MNDIPQSDFDWREAQELTGCSDQQVAFVRSVCQGASLTQAARVAKYAGKGSSLRGQASRIHKSRKVQSLLALARSGDAGVTEDVISRDACKRELSRMIRHGDASQKIRCIEGLEKMRAEERATQSDYPTTLEGLADAMLTKDDEGAGALALMATYFAMAKTLTGLPLPSRIYPPVTARFPGLVAQLVALLPANHEHHASGILADAEKFSKADTARRIPDAESQRPIEANGKAVA